MAAGLHIGVLENLFYNSATYGSPTWVAIPIVRDVDVNMDKSMAEVKARISTWKGNLPGIKDAPLEFEILADRSQATYGVLRAAWLADTLMDFAACDSATVATTGAESFRALYYIKGFAESQKLEDAEVIKVSCELAYSTNLPTFIDS